MHHSDEHICRLLRQNNSKGLELMFDHYYKSLVIWSDSFLNNIQTAEDIVQEFFVTFWEKKHFQNLTTGNLRGYIFASIKNRTLKYIAKNDPLKQSLPLFNIVVEILEPDDITDDILQAIKAEIEKLPPRTKEVLLAVYIEGMSYKDTALRFAISVATVNTLLVNALKRLRKVFSDLFVFFH